MKTEIRISVALATFQGERFLRSQLRSLADQTMPPDELVVSDDGSSDRTLEIVESFAQSAAFPVRIVRNEENLGYAKNFAQALSLCSGELVFLCDQDDVWFEDKIETVAGWAATHEGIQCFFNDAMLTDDSLKPAQLTKLQQIRAAGLNDTELVMGCCMAVKRDFLELALPVPPEISAHDNWLAGLADVLGLTRRSDEVLQYYRRHGNNTSDYFVNSASALGLRKRIGRAISRLPRRVFCGASLYRELIFVKAVRDRLTQCREACRRLVGDERMDVVLADLDFRLNLLSARKHVRQQSWFRRPVLVWHLWRKGNYACSGGRGGLLKDLLLRKQQ
ncbi:glycosyltransferase family 2 protein [Thiolapillus sp.]